MNNKEFETTAERNERELDRVLIERGISPLHRAIDKLEAVVDGRSQAIIDAQNALRGTPSVSMPMIVDADVPLALLKMALQSHGLETYLAYGREGNKLVTVLHVRTVNAGKAHRAQIRAEIERHEKLDRIPRTTTREILVGRGEGGPIEVVEHYEDPDSHHDDRG